MSQLFDQKSRQDFLNERENYDGKTRINLVGLLGPHNFTLRTLLRKRSNENDLYFRAPILNAHALKWKVA